MNFSCTSPGINQAVVVQIEGDVNFAATICSFLTHEFASVMRFDVRFF